MLHNTDSVPLHLLIPSIFKYGYQNVKIVNFDIPQPLRSLLNEFRKEMGEVK